MNRVRGLGRRQDPFGSRKQDGRGEDVVLEVRLGADQPVEHELRDQGRYAVVAKAARMDRGGDEVMSERMHRHERRQLARVAEVVRKVPARKRRAGGRLARQDVDLAAGDLLPQEREGEAGEVRAATDAADDHVGEGTCELHLRQRLLTDHGLVQEHVIEDAPERIGRVVASGCVLDRL